MIIDLTLPLLVHANYIPSNIGYGAEIDDGIRTSAAIATDHFERNWTQTLLTSRHNSVQAVQRIP